MRSIRLPALLAGALTFGLGASSARAQGWDYGRQMFGFAQYNPSTGWSSYYHPGDGRRGVYYVDAGGGNFYGDPRARPLTVPAAAASAWGRAWRSRARHSRWR
jgi:hypothetical protein